MTNQVEMFGDRPSGKPTKLALAEGGAPLWTAEKACLIDEYIHRFLLVTRHGVYLDLFAGPQRVDDTESWSVRRVLERRTAGNPSIRHYAVCDENPAQVSRLRELGGCHDSFHVYAGDVNERIEEVADKKHPDIRLSVPNRDLKAVIEVKIADNWTPTELKEALENQLAGQYLRHSNCRAGCFLLTYHGRKQYWIHPEIRKRMTFSELVALLSDKARDIENKSAHGARIAAFGLELTDPPLLRTCPRGS